MLTSEQKELFQKDKYELVDMIVELRRNKGKKYIPHYVITPPEGAIENAFNRLNKEMIDVEEKNRKSKTNKEEEC
jgi:peptide subunit release factor 1 (eRF1)